MKYVITWKPRAGASAADNEASAGRVLDLIDRPTAAPGTTLHQMVLRIDGEGGFAVVEVDDATALARTFYKFAPFNKYTAHPVIDMDEGLRLAREADMSRGIHHEPEQG
jgi:hypothetical protein